MDDIYMSAFKDLFEAVKVTANNGLENDKAIVKLCQTIAENINELANRVVESEIRIQHLETKIEMLHELYHTHFADDVKESIN